MAAANQAENTTMAKQIWLTPAQWAAVFCAASLLPGEPAAELVRSAGLASLSDGDTAAVVVDEPALLLQMLHADAAGWMLGAEACTAEAGGTLERNMWWERAAKQGVAYRLAMEAAGAVYAQL
jgi:hypothetical protein